jgi:1,4-alpha-glucan branching enzyme
MEYEDQQLLLEGLLHDPFRILGPHEFEQGWVWRVILPGAQAAWIEGTKGRVFPMTRTEGTPLFEWSGKRKHVKRYPKIRWTDHAGRSRAAHDPYQFRLALPKKAIARFNDGTSFDAYRVLGAHVERLEGITGVRFAVWAPNASRVSVVGDFNEWNGLAHPMQSMGHSGIWLLFIPGLGADVLYKFEIRDPGGIRLKADPYAFRAERRPRTASIVVAESAFEWGDDEWIERRRHRDWLHEPQTVYEVHLDSWRRPADENHPNYRDLAHQLVDYAASAGFTHVELLPIAEHPLDDSWGYQTTGYFAPTSRYGTPDDLKYFIDHAHRHGLGVFLDWTPAHFPKDAHGLALFDGTHLYEHADEKQREHPDWNTLVFNYGRNEVRSFLFSNAAYWLREFHIDGLRVDAVASMLYLDYSRKTGEWVPNEFGGNENLPAMQFLKELNIALHEEFPGAVIMAEESTAWPMVSRPVYLGGLGFSMKWNMGWMHDTLLYFSKDAVHRKFHHEMLTFTLIYAFHENFILPLSHDEVVHGKRSMLAKMPGDRWQQFANLRLLYCFQYAMPGKKLLFMGSEFGVESEWDFRSQLDWSLLEHPEHDGLRKLVGDLNRLIRDHPALHELDFEHQGFQWLDCNDSEHSVLAWIRSGRRGEVVCLFNFTPVPRTGYRVGVPSAGTYREILNSDSEYYGGSNVGNVGSVAAQSVPCMGQPASMLVALPPLGAVLMELEGATR